MILSSDARTDPVETKTSRSRSWQRTRRTGRTSKAAARTVVSAGSSNVSDDRLVYVVKYCFRSGVVLVSFDTTPVWLVEAPDWEGVLQDARSSRAGPLGHGEHVGSGRQISRESSDLK